MRLFLAFKKSGIWLNLSISFKENLKITSQIQNKKIVVQSSMNNKYKTKGNILKIIYIGSRLLCTSFRLEASLLNLLVFDSRIFVEACEPPQSDNLLDALLFSP